MANFDVLSTGNTGQTFGNEATPEVNTEAIEAQQAAIASLMPSVQAILDTLDAEVAAISDIRAYMTSLGPKPSAAVLSAEYRARELFIEMIGRLKSSITNKLADVEHQS